MTGIGVVISNKFFISFPGMMAHMSCSPLLMVRLYLLCSKLKRDLFFKLSDVNPGRQ
jgi:hypothetical protein